MYRVGGPKWVVKRILRLVRRIYAPARCLEKYPVNYKHNDASCNQQFARSFTILPQRGDQGTFMASFSFLYRTLRAIEGSIQL